MVQDLEYYTFTLKRYFKSEVFECQENVVRKRIKWIYSNSLNDFRYTITKFRIKCGLLKNIFRNVRQFYALILYYDQTYSTSCRYYNYFESVLCLHHKFVVFEMMIQCECTMCYIQYYWSLTTENNYTYCSSLDLTVPENQPFKNHEFFIIDPVIQNILFNTYILKSKQHSCFKLSMHHFNMIKNKNYNKRFPRLFLCN